MRGQAPWPTRVHVELEGQVVGVETIGAVDDQGPERVLGYQAVQLFDACLFEMFGQVHDVLAPS